MEEGKFLTVSEFLDDFVVVYDGKSPKTAAGRLAKYLEKTTERRVLLMDAAEYAECAEKFPGTDVIIIGHHSLAKDAIRNVARQPFGYGMEYGKGDRRYVLKASRRAVGKKDAFAGVFNERMSLSPYKELAEEYGFPASFRDYASTREAQYGWLWVEFALREFPRNTENGPDREPPPLICPPRVHIDRRPEEERVHEQKKIAELEARGQLRDGIVCCGGGAKGAFALGVWKYLTERGLTKRFTGFSGASVGALNTLLFVQDDYEKAEAVWLSMEDGDLVRPNENLGEFFLKSGGAAAKLAGFLIGWQKNAGLFSKRKLADVVRENISIESLREKLAYVSLTVLNLDPEEPLYPEYSYLDGLGLKDATVRKVLASAALPGAFVPEMVHRRLCIDGGVLDNCPVYPLVKAGFREILVIHLSPRYKKGEDRRERFDRTLREQFTPEESERVRFYHVWPETSLGSLLEINPELTRQRIQAGYEAASGQLADYV